MPKEADIIKCTNPFAALASDSESEPEVIKVKGEFRTWALPEESRFQTDDVKRNIFSSPFSKAKKMSKHWSRPRFREDDDGWTSIHWNQPQFQDDDPPVVYETRITDEASPMTAVAWAERIKKSLEKAELARINKVPEDFKEALGRLSFFRRPV